MSFRHPIVIFEKVEFISSAQQWTYRIIEVRDFIHDVLSPGNGPWHEDSIRNEILPEYPNVEFRFVDKERP